MPNTGEVVATGYFRTFLKDRRGKMDVGLFVDAARAMGYFVAMTREGLWVVKTRAPATSSPLLENKGVVAIPFASIHRVVIETDLLLIESEVETLALQLWVKNAACPSQGQLIEALAARFGLADTVKSIVAAQRKARLVTVGLAAVGLAAGFLWVLLRGE